MNIKKFIGSVGVITFIATQSLVIPVVAGRNIAHAVNPDLLDEINKLQGTPCYKNIFDLDEAVKQYDYLLRKLSGHEGKLELMKKLGLAPLDATTIPEIRGGAENALQAALRPHFQKIALKMAKAASMGGSGASSASATGVARFLTLREATSLADALAQAEYTTEAEEFYKTIESAVKSEAGKLGQEIRYMQSFANKPLCASCPPGTTLKTAIKKPPSTTMGGGLGGIQVLYERVTLNATQRAAVQSTFRAAQSSVVKYGGIALRLATRGVRLAGRGIVVALEVLNPAGWVWLSGDIAKFLAGSWEESSFRADVEMAREVTVTAAENDLKQIERLWPRYLAAVKREVAARACVRPTVEHTEAQKLLALMLRFKLDYLEQQARRYAVLMMEVELNAQNYADPEYKGRAEAGIAEVIRGNIERDGERINTFDERLFRVVFGEKFEDVQELIIEASIFSEPTCREEEVVCENDDGNGGGGSEDDATKINAFGVDICKNFYSPAQARSGAYPYDDPNHSQWGSGVPSCILTGVCAEHSIGDSFGYTNLLGFIRYQNDKAYFGELWSCRVGAYPSTVDCRPQPDITGFTEADCATLQRGTWSSEFIDRLPTGTRIYGEVGAGAETGGAGKPAGSTTRGGKLLAGLFGRNVSSLESFLRRLIIIAPKL